MADSSEYEDLDQLLQCAGWARFQAMVAKDWGATDGAGLRFVAAVTKAAGITEDPIATAQLRQIIVTQREIQKVMKLCQERFDSLKRTALGPDSDAVPQSRRGTL